MMPSTLVAPYGQAPLVNLLASRDRQLDLRSSSADWPSWDLTPQQLADLELLATGALSPLRGFLGRADYERVLAQRQLADGTCWPWPITLAVTTAFARTLEPGAAIALRDPEGTLLAALQLTDSWRPDQRAEADRLFGTQDQSHPGVARQLEPARPVCLAGELECVQLPAHHDFRGLRKTPAEIRAQLEQREWSCVLAVETAAVIHRCQHEQIVRAAEQQRANVLLCPAVGLDDASDRRYFARIRAIEAILPHFPPDTARLELVPTYGRHGGTREVLLRGIIHQNQGCSHLLIDPSAEAPPGAEHLALRFVPAAALGHVEGRDGWHAPDAMAERAPCSRFTESDWATCLEEGKPVPEWFSFREVTTELARATLPRTERGFTVLFTGLSGAGKSTTAKVLLVQLLEIGKRPVTLLDGDIVRRHLSSELSFSREHRDINIRRIGFVAAEITKNGGVAICAPIAPYRSVRQEIRAMIGAEGGFILVHVATPLEVCEKRDRKGVYAKARAGIIEGFTGISDPYEPPLNAEVTIDTTEISPADCAESVLHHLIDEGYLQRPPSGASSLSLAST